MRIQANHPTQGIALIIVMLVIFALSLLAAGFSYSMKVETRLAQNVEAEGDLIWAAKSGVDYAAWILAEEGATKRTRPHHSLAQFWAHGTGEFNEVFLGHSLDDVALGNARFSLRLEDLERRININTARREMLEKAVEVLGYDSLSAATVADSIEDWRGSTLVSGLHGAEEDYYLRLPIPYQPKKGPLDDLTELLLVKGVTPEMYWGAGRPLQLRRSRLAATRLGLSRATGGTAETAAQNVVGLVDLFTTQGVARVNINTASREVLQLLPGIDPAMADSIVEFRAGDDHTDGTEDDTPFESVGELATVGSMPPQLIQGLNAVCTVVSTLFEARVNVSQGDYERVYVAVLRSTGARNVQVITGHWE